MQYGRARLRWVDDTVNVGKGILTVRRAPMDVGAVITTMRISPEPAAVLFRLEERSPAYRRLQAALARYRMLAADSALTTLPRLPARLAPGQRYAGASSLRRLRWGTCPTRWRCHPSRATHCMTRPSYAA